MIDRNTYNYNCRCSIFHAQFPTFVCFTVSHPSRNISNHILSAGIDLYAQHSLISTYILNLMDKKDIEWAVQEFGFTGESDLPAISFFVNGEAVHTLRTNSPSKLFSPIQVDDELTRLARYVAERDIKVYRLLQAYRDLKEQEVSEVFELGRKEELQASSWTM